MNQLGFGVMINMLSGNQETVETLNKVKGKKIKDIRLSDNVLYIETRDHEIKLWDNGQSCCENRYMHTDDNLMDFIGAKIVNFELREAPAISSEFDEHEVQFLVVITDKGNITFSNHNEHNGYYGGFSIVASDVG